MPTSIRFAIWAAVSSDAQAAEDKYSLPEQVQRCRDLAASRGWQETSLPYIVPGESRTRWVNLSDAERAIPALHQLLNDAQERKFDLVLCYEFDRFRELLDPVARTLNSYGVQLYSVSQPLEPQAPTEYNPYNTDTDFLLRGMNQMISRAAIANLRRKYLTQMPRRITERGLGHMVPYGYHRPSSDRNAVPVPDANAAYVRLMAERLLAGHSLHQIAQELDQLQAPLPKMTGRKGGLWQSSTINRILSNPYYAGYVRWGLTKTRLDPRTGKTTRARVDSRRVVSARGRHQPLWDDSTRAALETELSRRTPAFRGRILSALTGLLRCSSCGSLLHRVVRGRGTARGTYWRCPSGGASHGVIEGQIILVNLAAEIHKAIQEGEIPAQNAAEDLRKKIAALESQLARIGDAYQAGVFDLAELSRRTSLVDDQIGKLERDLQDQNAVNASTAMRARALATLQQYADILPEYLLNTNAQEINHLLSVLFSDITVDSTGQITHANPPS